jgi:hypothetical protein
VLVTCDTDFLGLVAEDPNHPGIVFWLQDRHFGQLVRDRHSLSIEKTPEELFGRVVYVS